jgi:hypothetical protein
VFDLQGRELDRVFLEIIMKGCQHTPYPTDLAPAQPSDLLQVEKVLLINIGQLNLVFWDL